MPNFSILSTNSFFFVWFFGLLGVSLRFWLDRIFTIKFSQSWASTLIINLTGSFVLGLIVGLPKLKEPSLLNLKMGLMVGLCGGFTTFSTLSYLMLKFIDDGNILYAVLYGVGSLVAGLGAIYLGLLLGKLF